MSHMSFECAAAVSLTLRGATDAAKVVVVQYARFFAKERIDTLLHASRIATVLRGSNHAVEIREIAGSESVDAVSEQGLVRSGRS